MFGLSVGGKKTNTIIHRQAARSLRKWNQSRATTAQQIQRVHSSCCHHGCNWHNIGILNKTSSVSLSVLVPSSENVLDELAIPFPLTDLRRKKKKKKKKTTQPFPSLAGPFCLVNHNEVQYNRAVHEGIRPQTWRQLSLKGKTSEDGARTEQSALKRSKGTLFDLVSDWLEWKNYEKCCLQEWIFSLEGIWNFDVNPVGWELNNSTNQSRSADSSGVSQSIWVAGHVTQCRI